MSSSSFLLTALLFIRIEEFLVVICFYWILEAIDSLFFKLHVNFFYLVIIIIIIVFNFIRFISVISLGQYRHIMRKMVFSFRWSTTCFSSTKTLSYLREVTNVTYVGTNTFKKVINRTKPVSEMTAKTADTSQAVTDRCTWYL